MLIIFLTEHPECYKYNRMRDTRYNFKMGDVRKCFSTIGDTTLTKWLDKGLIGCDSDRKSIRTNIRYTALGIVHIGVLGQLSLWGVLNYYQDVSVVLGIRGNSLLTEPDRIIDYYNDYGPNLRMIVTSYQTGVNQPNKRMRASKTNFEIRILSSDEASHWQHALEEEYDPAGDPFAFEPLSVPRPDDVPEEKMSFGFLKLDLHQIIGHVYNQLGVEHLLDKY